MAKNQNRDQESTKHHNGVDHDHKEQAARSKNNNPKEEVKDSIEDIQQNAQGEIKEIRQAVMKNPQLLGWLSLGSGVLLVLHAFGAFSLLNYVIGLIGAGLVAYGGWKINLIRKTQKVAHKLQDYVEDYSTDTKQKKKK